MKDECYEFIKNEIGKTNIVGFGSYGEVKIARNTDNSQIVAIKLVKFDNKVDSWQKRQIGDRRPP